MPEQRTIWKRRAVLMAAVGLVIAIPVTIAVRSGDDSGDEPSTTSVPAPDVEVGGVEFDRGLGVELRLPKGWERKRQKKAVVFESPDGSALIAISTPGPAEDVSPIQAAAIRSVKSRYRAAKVGERIKKQRLGGRPAEAAVIAARHPKKRAPIRILVATAKGEKLAYLVEVFAAGPSSLVDAQVLLNNLALEG